MHKRKFRALRLMWFIPAAAWIALLFYLSGQDGGQSGALSRWLAEGLLRRMPFLDVEIETFEFVLRKLAHFGVFAVEGFLLRFAMGQVRPAGVGNNFTAIVISGGIAALNELHQLTSEGRVCSWTDVGIDAAGALAGVITAAVIENLVWAVVHRRRKRKRALDRRRGM